MRPLIVKALQILGLLLVALLLVGLGRVTSSVTLVVVPGEGELVAGRSVPVAAPTKTPIPQGTPVTGATEVSTWTPTREPTNAAPTSTPASPVPTSTPAPGQVVWSTGMESGNLADWTRPSIINGSRQGGSYDSGICQRPPNGVSNQYKHSGNYSMLMTIDVSSQESGCRQFRHAESVAGGAYYYSAWLYVPVRTVASQYWNIFQFKSNNNSGVEEPVWVLDLLPRPNNGPLALRLRWKGIIAGPLVGDSAGLKNYTQSLMDVIPGQWAQLQAYLRQAPAGSYTGQLTVWQDGVMLWDFPNSPTKYSGGDNRWSVNNYSNALSPPMASLFFDDLSISTAYVPSEP